MNNRKNERWTRPRHAVVRNLLFATLGVYTRLKYRIKVEKNPDCRRRQYLILYNHQTAFDQNFVGMAFPGPIYYLATEDIFSNGLVSRLIRSLLAPIPIKKQTTDLAAVRNCIKVVKEGGTIAIAPEGNRTYSGRTEYMSPAIASMAKRFGLPIALFRIEGGYGVHPRWSDVVRRGSMRAYVSRVIEPEEYQDMPADELARVISEGLFVDEGVADASFIHKRRAEYLERAMYYCPNCGLSRFYSHGATVSCTKCGLTARYTEKKELVGVGCEFPYRFVSQWYDAQSAFVNRLDPNESPDKPLFTDTCRISEVIPCKKKICIAARAELKLYGNRVEIKSDRFSATLPFGEITGASVLGKNKVNLYTSDNKIYQLKGDKRFNGLTYVNLYYRYYTVMRGEENAEFLGL